MTLLAFAAARRAAAAPLLLGAQRLLPGRPAANPPHPAAADDRRDRQTDGQTPDRYLDPAADSANNRRTVRVRTSLLTEYAACGFRQIRGSSAAACKLTLTRRAAVFTGRRSPRRPVAGDPARRGTSRQIDRLRTDRGRVSRDIVTLLRARRRNRLGTVAGRGY